MRAAVAVVGCAVALAVTPMAHAQERVDSSGPVLVIPFEPVAEQDRLYWLREGAAVLLTNDLEARGTSIITRAERLQAFQRLQVPPIAALSHATVIRVGQLLGAGSIVYGTIALTGDVLEVRTRAIHLDTGQIETESVDRAPLDGLFDLFHRIAGRLSTDASDVLPAASPERPPLAAFENYVKGLLAEAPATQAAFLEGALKLAPDYGDARLALWDVQTDLGDHKRALATASAVSSRSKLWRRARFLATVSQVHLKQFEEASKGLRALLADAPAAALYNNLGVVQIRRGTASDLGGAPYHFNKAAEADAAEPDYFFNLGYAYALARDQRAAIYWLRQAVRLNPADGTAHLILGVALKASGSELEAAREHDLAAQLAEDDSARREETGTVPRGLERLEVDLEGSGTRRVDLVLIASEQRDEREVAAYHLSQGRRLFEAERDREAIVELRRCLYLSPYQHEANLLIGRIYLRTGRVREAVDALTISLWSQETSAAHVALGEALLQAKDEAGARREAERAAALDPVSPEAQELLRKLNDPR